jgi:PncC family amidohydrolase
MDKLIVEPLQKRGMRLVTAESCTGGALAARFAVMKGAGDVFAGGIVAYQKATKVRMLGVSDELLSRPAGAVTAEVAEQMASGAIRVSGASIAVAVTGVVGPDTDEDDNPVGLVYLAIALGAEVHSLRCRFDGFPPEAVRAGAIEAALNLLAETLADWGSGG